MEVTPTRCGNLISDEQLGNIKLSFNKHRVNITVNYNSCCDFRIYDRFMTCML